MAETAGYRHLKVFVSSTFQDMQNERLVLMSRVFPQVAEYCHKKGAEFSGVDLRWGITDEQAARGETVDICMDEIDHCRPLFIGILGERYGWIPEGSGISVTEQEILYGALDAPDDTEAFFYLRDPVLTEQICGSFEIDPRQTALKEKIRRSGYPILDGYKDIDTFAERVLKDLLSVSDRILTSEETVIISPVTEARRTQLSRAERIAAGYVERTDLSSALDRISRLNDLVLITGLPGTGKTALLSEYCLDLIAKGSDNDYVFLYYAGYSAEGGWMDAAGQLIRELCSHYDVHYPAPSGSEETRKALNIVLNMAAVKAGCITIAIDSIDALSLNDGIGLSWLPETLPERARVILTLGSGDTLSRFRHRKHAELELNELEPDEIVRIAEKYLAIHSKTLSASDLKMLRDSDAARNPEYLITLLDEIRHIGRHEELSRQISDYLDCRGMPELCGKVLERADTELSDPGGNLPAEMLSLLTASGRGLTEAEIIPLLGNVPYAYFAPLRIALDRFISLDAGALRLTSAELREAAIERYGIDEKRISECRQRITDWFLNNPETPRYGYVLPYILRERGAFTDLHKVMSDIYVFTGIWKRNSREAKEYWALLGKNGYSPSDSYAEIIRSPGEKENNVLLALAELFLETGDPENAMTLLETVTAEGRDGTYDDRSQAFGLEGNLCQMRGDLSGAERAYQKKYLLARKAGDRYEQQRALGNLGLVALTRGDLKAAEENFRSVLRMAESLNHRDAEQTALGNLGNIFYARGDLEGAESLFLRQLAASYDSGNMGGIINAHGALGIIASAKGERDSALKEFELQEKFARDIGDISGLANALGNLAGMKQAEGMREAAMALLEEKLKLCRDAGLAMGEQSALGNIAALKAGSGNLAEACDDAFKRTKLTKEKGLVRQHAEALLQLSRIESLMSGEYRKASELHRMQAEAIIKQNERRRC